MSGHCNPVNEANGIWTVSLPASAPYPYVRFKRGRLGYDYAVVVVDIHLLLSLHDRSNMRIPEPSAWDQDKLDGIRNFLDPNDPGDPGDPEMPRVSVWDAPMSGWLSRFGHKRHADVIFGNGRHRTHYLRYVGATHIPVEVASSSRSRIQELCGIANQGPK